MKLSISNIGWSIEQDEAVYSLMKEYGFTGLEIAPTRIFPEKPYELLPEAAAWSSVLMAKYGFTVSSMQSIWFGRQEQLFGTDDERKTLLHYTKRAVDFAASIGCKNMVFGCPRNRVVPKGTDSDLAIGFFREIGNYAAQNGTIIGMEANPEIYHTNYINDTSSALELVKRVNSKGFRLNLDVGTMVHNHEDIASLEDNVQLISHVHISEPELKELEPRRLHLDLKKLLLDKSYRGYVSIEMGKTDDLSVIEEKMKYVRSVFQ